MLNENLALPVIAAPMAGGPGTPDLVIDVTRAGGWGFLAAGNKSVAALAKDVEAVRRAGVPVGVNVFVPGQRSRDAEILASLAAKMTPIAQRFDVELGEPAWDDDDFGDKIAWLATNPINTVTFTFGLPDASVIGVLKRSGAELGAMVTNADDAVRAQQSGMDFLVVQGPEAGGHQSTFDIHAAPGTTPLRELLRTVKQTVSLPLIAAGGIGTPADVREVLAEGAIAAQIGTAFLRSESSGTNTTHKAALTSSAFTETALTRAFSGRYARSLVNDFMRDVPDAPAAYPEINRLMGPLRKAAASAGNAQWTNLWAGSSWKRTLDAMPEGLATSDAGSIARWLAGVA